jgi:small-conductance mechanosensitive channel
MGYLLFTSFSLVAQSIDTVVGDRSDSATFQGPEKHHVKLNGDTLFSVQASLGPYSASVRAEVLSEHLKNLKKKEKILIDSFYLSTIDGYSVIVYKKELLYYISKEDAAYYGQDREVMAAEYVEVLKSAFSEVLERKTVKYWLTHIGFTLLAILGLIIIFFLINKAYKWVNKRLSSYERTIKRKRKSILRYLLPQDTKHAFLLLSKVVRIALLIVILILYLPLLFNFLPWTEGLVEQFYGYLAKPLKDVLRGLLAFLPNVFYIFVIIVIARYVVRALAYITNEIDEGKYVLKGFHKDWARPTFNIVKIILYAFTLVFVFPYLPGSDSPAFKGVSIFLGVLFSLGSTSAIANIVAGIVITYMRPFVVGDRVKIGDSVGDIMEKNLLVTRMKTIRNEDITIPNATIINNHLWNYSKYANSIGIILHPTVTIGYDVPSEQVTKLLLQAAQNTKNLTREFKPFVLQKSLSDFYVEYELNVYTKQPKKMAHFYSELNKTILDEFNAAGVEILSPHYSAFRDGNASTIPSKPAKPVNPVEDIVDTLTGKKQGK